MKGKTVAELNRLTVTGEQRFVHVEELERAEQSLRDLLEWAEESYAPSLLRNPVWEKVITKLKEAQP